MNLTVDPRAPIPLYAQVVDQIGNKILSGQMQPGEALPSVRQLGQALEINSLTIQKAYKILEAKELIEIKRGVGAFVRGDVDALPDRERVARLRARLEPVVRLAVSLKVDRARFAELTDELWPEDES